MTAEAFAALVFSAAENSSLYDLSDVNWAEFQIHAAIYAYASINHSGQNSDLYSVISSSEFRPGLFWNENDEIECNEFYPLVEQVAKDNNII